MTKARNADVTDSRQLVRLRGIMLAAVDGGGPEPGPWQESTYRTFRRALAEPDGRLAAFVVDKPDRAGELAACAVGTIERRLASPANPSGETGHVFSVATDPGYRRRGYSRACLRALLAWYGERGVTRIDLHASDEGLPLYRSLGFVIEPTPLMRLTRSVGEPPAGR